MPAGVLVDGVELMRCSEYAVTSARVKSEPKQSVSNKVAVKSVCMLSCLYVRTLCDPTGLWESAGVVVSKLR